MSLSASRIGQHWVPKRNKLNRLVDVITPSKGARQVQAQPLTVRMDHPADNAVLCQLPDGKLLLLRLTSLRRHWRQS